MRSGGRLKLFLVELSKGMLQLVKPFLFGVSDRPQPQEAVLAHDVAKAMASLAELLGALPSVKKERDLGQQLVVKREQRHSYPWGAGCRAEMFTHIERASPAEAQFL